MVIQFTRDARHAYVKMVQELEGRAKHDFIEAINSRYEKKIFSEEGEFNEFVITKNDIIEALLSNNIGVANLKG